MNSNLTLALQLLDDDHKRQIGRGVFRLAKRLDARLGSIPDAAGEGSIANFVRAVEGFLRTNDPQPLMETVRGAVELRRLAGYEVPQLMAISHAYLPVIRKVFLHDAADPKAALGAFEVVESAVLPLMVRLLQEFHAAEKNPGPGFDEPTEPFSIPVTEETAPSPFNMVSLEDVDDL